MARKNKPRKHIPKRTCIGCKQVHSKKSLIRIVRTSDGIRIDLTGKIRGRGAYLHADQSCWEKGINSSLEKALKTTLSKDDIARLKDFASTLPNELNKNS
ncbi:MAG: YlxR family protein [Anaerolineales bacterium]|nr:YlxR family protein [Anaerolineales bacterium]HEY61363.1 YlxR family protein [Anaerolineae bacterium]